MIEAIKQLHWTPFGVILASIIVLIFHKVWVEDKFLQKALKYLSYIAMALAIAYVLWYVFYSHNSLP